MRRCPVCKHEVSADHERCPGCGAALARNADSDLEGEVRALLQSGRKIEAIKLYRERTGVGLREAKDAVEAFERGSALPTRERMDPNLEQDLIVLLEHGKKIQAIKIYREATGSSLHAAKLAVEALAREYRLNTGRTGCLGLGVTLIGITMLVWHVVA